MVGAHPHIVVIIVVGEFIGLNGRIGIQGTSSMTMLLPKRSHYNGFYTLAGYLIRKIRRGRTAIVLISILAHCGSIDFNGYGLMMHRLFAGVQGRLVVVRWKHLFVIRLLDLQMLMIVMVMTPLLMQQSSSLCAPVVTMMMMMMPVVIAVAVVMVGRDHTTATTALQSGLGGIISLPATAAACLLTANQSLLLGSRGMDNDDLQSSCNAAIIFTLATASWSGQHLVIIVILKRTIIVALTKVQHLEVLVIRSSRQQMIVSAAAHCDGQRELMLLGMGCM